MQTLKTSLFGAVNMLGLAKRTGAVILQASTSEVYGDLEISLQTESYWGNVNPIEFTILELANLIIEKTNSQSEIVLSQLPSDDPRQQKPDITKAIQTLKWSPKINLDESLLLSIPYFKDQLFT
jgi:UDP-glucuronate decarboxylase